MAALSTWSSDRGFGASSSAGTATVNVGKVNLGWASIGIAEHSFLEAIGHAHNRVLYGTRVTDFPHVRRMLNDAYLATFGLPVADKPDSQDICFVPDGDYASLVKKLRPETAAPGEIVHVDGRVLGNHAGVVHFTIGGRSVMTAADTIVPATTAPGVATVSSRLSTPGI